MTRTGIFLLSAIAALAAAIIGGIATTSSEQPASTPTEVQRIETAGQTGQAFRLIYTVNVPLRQFWQFKTDFDGDFLLTNRYINSHRLVSRHHNVYITETRYTDAPGTVFRWQTTIYPLSYRMNYLLLNPEECGQKFNRGTIQMSSDSGKTRVVHSTYFDFFGATVWAHFPGPGGMVGFLRYTAEWEKKTIKQLQHRYLQ